MIKYLSLSLSVDLGVHALIIIINCWLLYRFLNNRRMRGSCARCKRCKMVQWKKNREAMVMSSL